MISLKFHQTLTPLDSRLIFIPGIMHNAQTNWLFLQIIYLFLELWLQLFANVLTFTITMNFAKAKCCHLSLPLTLITKSTKGIMVLNVNSCYI